MFDKLDFITDKYNELSAKVSDPEITELKSSETSSLVPYFNISELFFPDILERDIVVITGP